MDTAILSRLRTHVEGCEFIVPEEDGEADE
jgi:hypothetical protein